MIKCSKLILVLSTVLIFGCSSGRDMSLRMPQMPGFYSQKTPILVSQKKIDEAQVYYDRGLIAENDGFMEKAINEYEKAVEISPNHFDAVYALAKAYAKIGNRPPALDTFKNALRLQPDNPELHNALGNLYKDMNKLDDAIDEYNTAIKLDPTFSMAYTNLGLMYSTRKYMIDMAIKFYKKSIELNTDLHASAISHYQLGIIYFYKGDETTAINEYKSAISKYPDYAPPHFKLGELYVRRLKNQDAVLHFEEFLRVVTDLKSDDAKKARRYLRNLKK